MTTNNKDSLVVNDKQAMQALKQHGEKIVWAIVLVLAAFFGWQFYQKNYAKVDAVAADSYTAITERNDALSLAAQNPDLDATAKANLVKEQEALYADIDKLVAAHGKTVYAWQALMIKARHQTDGEQYAEAVKTLEQAQALELGDEGLTAITKLRLAQVLLASGGTDKALELANATLPKAFEASRQELLGDIYVAKNDTENAKQAYGAAWEALRERQESRALLSLKMQALGMTPTPIEAKAPVVATPVTTEASKAVATDGVNASAAASSQ